MRVALFFGAVAAVQMEAEEKTSAPVEVLKEEMAMLEEQIEKVGKITPGVYETIKKLEMMVTKVIEPAIKESHSVDQMLVFTLYREIVMCDAVYRKFLSGTKQNQENVIKTVRTEWATCMGSVDTLKMRFKRCLDERDALVRMNNTVCCQQHAMCDRNGYMDCENIKFERGFVGCDYRQRTGGECFAAAQKMIYNLEGYFRGQDKKFEMLRHKCMQFEQGVKAKIAECSYLMMAVNAKVGEANKVSMDINNGGDNAKKGCKVACDMYKSCRMKTMRAFMVMKGPCMGDGTLCHDNDKDGKQDCDVVVRNNKLVKSGMVAGGKCAINREVDRQNEWYATQHIKCVLSHYRAGGRIGRATSMQCMKEINVYHLKITFPMFPPMIPCKFTICDRCPSCSECVDRPYYQYETPCYDKPAIVPTTCVERPECPGWCQTKDSSAPKKMPIKKH